MSLKIKHELGEGDALHAEKIVLSLSTHGLALMNMIINRHPRQTESYTAVLSLSRPAHGIYARLTRIPSSDSRCGRSVLP